MCYDFKLTYLNQSISGYLKSPPTKWISLDLLSFMTGICCHQETGGILRLESLRSVVAGVSSLLRFSVPVCSLVRRALSELCYVRLCVSVFACSLEFHRTLKIITRILREVVNRERLCGTNTFCFGCFHKVFGLSGTLGSTDTIYLCLGCWMVR